MSQIGIIIVKRCINIIIMLLPSLLWLTLFMCDVCFGISHPIFKILTYSIMGLLCFTMLFLNAILKVQFTENGFEHMEYAFKKPDKHELFYSFITGMPLVLILFLAPIYLFILYGMLQFFYILVDKEHKSIMERLFVIGSKIVAYFKNKLLSKRNDSEKVSLKQQ